MAVLLPERLIVGWLAADLLLRCRPMPCRSGGLSLPSSSALFRFLCWC